LLFWDVIEHAFAAIGLTDALALFLAGYFDELMCKLRRAVHT
jgi:hypothetical protein